MTQSGDTAWDTFWAQEQKQARQTGAATGGGCMPDAWRSIAAVQEAAWTRFAKPLPKGARLLDIASGDGRVLAMVAGSRGDLDLTGVDGAPNLPPPPRGAVLRGGVPMEKLPFADRSFDVVTSQFGFEYGDHRAIAAQIARVLRPDGVLGLITHRLDGPIVAHNRKRRAAIAWAIEEQDLPAIARRSLTMRGVGIRVVPPAIERAPVEGARAFGEGSAAWEIAEAIRRTLLAGRMDDPRRVDGILGEIERQAANELGRIRSLETAATSIADEDYLPDLLRGFGFDRIAQEALEDGVYPGAFADFGAYRLRA